MNDGQRVLKAIILAIFLIVTSADAQQKVIVEMDSARSIIPEIQLGEYDNEVVTIEGFVTRWEKEEFRTTVLYWLRNRWGDTIVVRTPDDNPEVNQQYRITGTVGVFGSHRPNERYIDERRRELLTDRRDIADRAINRATQIVSEVDRKWWLDASAAQSELMIARQNLNRGNSQTAINHAENAERMAANASYSTLFYLVMSAGVILMALLITLLVLVIRKPSSATAKQEISSKPRHLTIPETDKVEKDLPKPNYVEGETIKMHQPPSKTLKVFPGRFEIISGDTKIKEIRLFRLPDETDGEFTFGRNAGTPYRHIQIENPTISRDQAKILYSKGKYTLVNRADPNKSNTTMINDRPMDMNELHELIDGDKITMGVVTMKYHAK